MVENIVTVTKSGQATIPKALREKHNIGNKVLAIDTEEGVLFKAIQNPVMEKGSLKALFGTKTSRQLVEEVRAEEPKKEKRLPEKGGTSCTRARTKHFQP